MSYSGRRRFRRSKQDLDVLEATSEEFRIKVDVIFRTFISDPTLTEFSFPSTLANLERKYIHTKASKLNMLSKSHGSETNRTLTIYKKNKESNFESFYIDYSPESLQRLIRFNILYKNVPLNGHITRMNCKEKVFGKLVLGRPPEVTPPTISEKILTFQTRLPVYEMKDEIINKIRNNRVLVISSETGSGKTTQIPQYIMDDARIRGETCRIVCTQPRRISAVSVATRVSEERGSLLGETVGYHIRLQSKFGTKSNLIYCTNGVLIRSLMCGDEVLSSLTHIIIDEVHERDKLSDFLLICLRQILRMGRNIKVILMSATINIDKFFNYFNGQAEIISIPGRLFKIQEFFLEDVLKITDYQIENDDSDDLNSFNSQENQVPEFNSYFDEMIEAYNCPDDDNGEAWSNLLQCISSDEMPVDYQHSESGYSALMVAVEKGSVNQVEQLCSLGANPNLFTSYGISPKSLAPFQQNPEIDLLLNHASKFGQPSEALLRQYQKTFNDDEIDHQLLVKLIEKIHSDYMDGSILVFLPGYDDIMICSDNLMDSSIDSNSYCLFYLHGSMDIHEQRRVFKPMNKRKIILSTNIAETSLTIDDVLYVIDTGKAKQQSYDSISNIYSLQIQWISQACVKQRAGRAGRTASGICFHMFSKSRYSSFLTERVPEILRVPLEELCLNTKTLTGNYTSIYSFLELAPDPPSSVAVKMAIINLVRLGALDDNEHLTQLGEYLSQLTVEPHLGKILIFSVIFRCLDPVLTIVSSLAQKDPFQLPTQANKRPEAFKKRKSLTENVLSDHLVYLKGFIKWQEAMLENNGESFCKKYYISTSMMDTILKTRCQLLGQLRAAKFVPAHKSVMKELNCFSNNWPLIKAILSCGLYPKFAFNKLGHFCTRTEHKVLIHNSSTLSKEPIPIWFIFDEMIKIRHSSQIRGVTPITPITRLREFTWQVYLCFLSITQGMHFFYVKPFQITLICGIQSTNPKSNYLTIDDWLEFEFPDNYLINLRKAIEIIIKKTLMSPLNLFDANDVLALETFADILYIEDVAANMSQPYGIRSKPRFFDLQPRDLSKNSSLNSSPTLSTVDRNESNLLQEEDKNSRKIRTTPSPVPPALTDSNSETSQSAFHNILDTISRNISNLQNIQNQFSQISIGNDENNIRKFSNGFQLAPTDNFSYYSNGWNSCDSSSEVLRPSSCGSSSSFQKVLDDIASNFIPETNSDIQNEANSCMQNATNCDDIENVEQIYLLLKVQEKSVKIAYTVKEWKFSPQTEKLILQYSNLGKQIFFLFSDYDKKMFYGIAEFNYMFEKNSVNRAKITWTIQMEFPFSKTTMLRNACHNFRLLCEGPDGQRIDNDVMGQFIQLVKANLALNGNCQEN